MAPAQDRFKIASDILRAADPTERKATMFFGHEPVLFVYHPDTVKPVLTCTTKLINKAKEYRYLECWLGTGLLISSDGKWHQRRKLLTPAFHFQILDEALDVFNEQVHAAIGT